MKTEVEKRMDAVMDEAQELINNCKFTVRDAERLLTLCNNILIHYKQIRDARDNWKIRYMKLKKEVGDQ